MKKIALLFLVICSSLFAAAQKMNDKIVLGNGGSIKCHIIDADTLAGAIKYVVNRTEGPRSIPLKNVLSYTIDDKVFTGKYTADHNMQDATPVHYENNKAAVGNHEAGNKLISFSSTAQVGVAFMLAGTLITAFPAVMPTENRDPQAIIDRTKQLTAIGMVLSSVGAITLFSSFASSRSAGKLLNTRDRADIGITSDGLTLKIPIKKE